MTINRNDKSTSISTQLDSLIPASKISNLTQGMFVGAVSDNFDERIDQNLDFEDLADLPDMDELAKMSPDEFLKTLEKTMAEKTKEDIEAIQSLEQVEKEEEAAIDEITEVDEGKREPYLYYIHLSNFINCRFLFFFNLL